MAHRVSVVMAVYNGERYLSAAIESVLSQTFTDFEFIIINDGSTDGTLAILESYDDARIVLANNQENIGLSRSLNKALALAQSDYVARMDADDVALPHRFEKQFAFLEAHPEIGILGSHCRLIDLHGQVKGLYRAPENDLQIRWRSLIANPFWHPTVMIRRHVLVQTGLSYDRALQTSQDYDLWVRMLKSTRGANLKEPLLHYRLCHGITSTRRELQLKNHDAISLRTIQEELPGFAITLEQVSQLRALFVGGNEFTPVLETQRSDLTHLYLDMFETFLACHPGEPDLKGIQREEALRVMRLILHSPPQPGWGQVVSRLMTINPALPWSFLSYLSKAAGRRLRQFTLNMLRVIWYQLQ